jgi:hypothetical protein
LPVITELSALDLELGGNGEFYSAASKKLGISEENMTDLNKSICVAFMGILRWREEYNFLLPLPAQVVAVLAALYGLDRKDDNNQPGCS